MACTGRAPAGTAPVGTDAADPKELTELAAPTTEPVDVCAPDTGCADARPAAGATMAADASAAAAASRPTQGTARSRHLPATPDHPPRRRPVDRDTTEACAALGRA